MNSPDLDAALLSLVNERRQADESIWSFEIHETTVTVLLIKDANIPAAHFMQSMGLAGGEGRVLTFERLDGDYRFLREAKWIG